MLTSPDVGGIVVSAELDGGDGIARGVLLGLGGPTTSVIGAAEEASPILAALCSATRLILAGEAYVAEEGVFVDQNELVLLLEPSSSLGPESRWRAVPGGCCGGWCFFSSCSKNPCMAV